MARPHEHRARPAGGTPDAYLLPDMRTSLIASLLFAAIAGCTGTGTGSVSYSASVSPPPLVYINADVQVIEDYDQPVFYSENLYWRYDNGVWYRSQYHTRGWVRVTVVPAQIRRIDRPTAYVRYRGTARAAAVRDQRRATPPPAPAPVVRDHRQEEKREIREERREIKQEQQEDRRERKEDLQDAKRERKEDQQDAKRERKEDQQEKKQDRKDDRKDHKDHGKNHKH